MWKYYGSSYIFTAIALVLGYILLGWQGLMIVAILGVLETSLSFDNAVVNASVLKNWGPVWRRRFLVWGMPIAVFGMRLVFPLLIVAIVAGVGPFEAINLAVSNPKEYERILTSVHHEIAAFGGAFLMMVFLKFFFDEEKIHHWVAVIEKPLAKLGRLEAIGIVITMGVILAASAFIPATEQLAFLTAGMWGLITYVLADATGSLVGGGDDDDQGAGSEATGRVIKEGVAGFMYLEILDASFSFDGVIAAFALTNNIFIMMIGLAVGAMFVRSMTLHLVEKGTLSEFRYLEHGAFWAIGALAVIMFLGVVVHVPEVITGLIGAAAIGLALWSSIKANNQDAEDLAIQIHAYEMRKALAPAPVPDAPDTYLPATSYRDKA